MQTRMNFTLARRFEEEVAAVLGGRRVFLSGAGMEKADVRKKAQYTLCEGRPLRSATLAFRVEAKTTMRDRYQFVVKDWRDLVRVADRAGELPIFAVKFLRHEAGLAIVREGFALELGFTLLETAPRHVRRSLSFYPERGQLERVVVPHERGHREDTIVALPYRPFVESVREHDDFGQEA